MTPNDASLAMVPWERYMLADDTRRYSMTCHIRFWFEGTFDSRRFTAALDDAMDEHPLLRARLAGRRWQLLDREHRPPIDWQLDAVPLVLAPQCAPDLRTRLFVREGAGKTLIVVQFHHSVSDGIGIFNFFETLLMHYHGMTPTAAGPRYPLALRATFGLKPGDWRRRTGNDLRRIANFFKTEPKPLWGSAPKSTGPASLAAAERQVFGGLERAVQVAKAHGVTLNDLMLAELYHTVAAWQTISARSRPGQTRIGVPTSLRTAVDATLSATNVVSMVFLDRGPKDLADPDALLEGIATEMAQVKDDRMGLTLIRVINFFARVPFLLRAFMRVPRCQASVILTNLGRPFAGSPLMGDDGYMRVGQGAHAVTLVGLDTMPPVRHLTRLSISVNGYGGKLSVTGRYDGTVMTAVDAQWLIGNYGRRLAEPLTERNKL